MKLGIDLGGTTIRLGLVNDSSEIVDVLEQMTCPEDGPDAVIGRIADLTGTLVQKSENRSISHIGIGCPGVLDRNNGIVVYSNNIGWRQVPVCRMLEERFHIPVYIENDANCAAVGEYLAGAGKNSSHMIMITLGTGIGGGMVLHGRLYRGKHGNAGIFGHILIEKDGKRCTCLRKGCWESYASAKALLTMASKAGVFEHQSPDKINGQLFFQILESKHPRAIQVFDEYTDYLAEGIADLVNVFDPERIVIGGGISAQGRFLLPPVRSKVKQKIYFSELDSAEIVCSTLANDAAVIGAANLHKF